MSCNGCRVLRKGCSESCMLRPCLQWIESPESQGHATVFVAKFFGRAGLMSFISAVPAAHRPALFQSLLFEACGRTVNPVNGAVGLLWTGNWHVCQAAVETVLRGGALRPIHGLLGDGSPSPAPDEASDSCTDMWKLEDPIDSRPKRRRVAEDVKPHPADLDLRLTPGFPVERLPSQIRRPETPSMNSGTSTCLEGSFGDHGTATDERKLLKLFH